METWLGYTIFAVTFSVIFSIAWTYVQKKRKVKK